MSERLAGGIEVFDHCPEFLDYYRVRFKPLGLETVTRWLYLIARRVATALRRMDPEAEAIAAGADEISAVLRELNPVLVCARFALDSPLRCVPPPGKGGPAIPVTP